MAQKERFFKKWGNEKWFFEATLGVMIFLFLCWGRSQLLHYTFWGNVGTLIFDLMVIFVVFALMTWVIIPIIVEICLNVWGIIETIIKNDPGRYKYPLKFDEYVISRWNTTYCVVVFLIVFVLGYFLSPWAILES